MAIHWTAFNYRTLVYGRNAGTHSNFNEIIPSSYSWGSLIDQSYSMATSQAPIWVSGSFIGNSSCSKHIPE